VKLQFDAVATNAEIAKADIVQIIEGAGIELTRETADRYRGLCPFHADTSPSLVVTPSKGLWHCFGCEDKKNGGNVVQFLQKVNHISFPEALALIR